ncbi:E3 ubiquitin-protein ligase ATL4-like [Henckelia pumila]|uniref:E3 ubiquitin-protein ligase ATL4-like n=1 Tax=Henckelia pumila TaxID=405737 RepID=UPI003C6DD8A6
MNSPFSSSSTPPPPPSIAVVYDGSATPEAVITQIPDQQQQVSNRDASPSSSYSSSSSMVIVIIIIASAIIVSASIYVLLRLFSKRFHRSSRTFAAPDDVVLRLDESGPIPGRQCHVDANGLLDSMPLFTFRSVTGSALTGGDCAVCLSKFEPHDQLRLLPLCCHAFHADCIDTWIVSNQTCPLCRSTVLPSDADVLDKIAASENRGIDSFRSGNGNGNGDSFRIEIGSISRRRGAAESGDGAQRSYSLGSFEYIVEDGFAISMGSTTHRRGISDCTSVENEAHAGNQATEPPGDALAGEVAGGGRNWLREYVDRLASVSISSRAMSFRSSGRFFSGSSRRSETVIAADDLEANRAGEEISELFRWLSGV